MSRLSRILEKNARDTANVRRARYVGPVGDEGIHDVRVDGVTIRTGSALPVSFRPGSIVPVGIPDGRTGETILSIPGIGDKGTSLVPIIDEAEPYKPEDPINPDDFPPLPPGFGPIAGPWGRAGTLLVARHNLILDPPALPQNKRRIEIWNNVGPHPVVDIRFGGAILQEAEGPPNQENPYHHHITPGCNLLVGGWPVDWALVCQTFGVTAQDFDIPIVNKLRNTQCYNDAGTVRCFDVFPGTAEQIIWIAFNIQTGLQNGGSGTNVIMTETIYEISTEEAGL